MSSANIINVSDHTLLPLSKERVRIKICGMKYSDNITDLAALQPDYLGFIFYENSSRFFNGTILTLPDNIKKVGVFVNASLQEIIEKVETHKLDLVQLHGEESPEFCKDLKHYFKEKMDIARSKLNPSTGHEELLTFSGVIKVFSVKDHFNFDQLKPYESVCDYFLFDTKGQLPGGNGYTFNWDTLNKYPSTKPYFLSGGIGLEEIDDLNAFLLTEKSKLCIAIDVNSKFEIKPGFKNISLLKEFKNKIKPKHTAFENP